MRGGGGGRVRGSRRLTVGEYVANSLRCGGLWQVIWQETRICWVFDRRAAVRFAKHSHPIMLLWETSFARDMCTSGYTMAKGGPRVKEVVHGFVRGAAASSFVSHDAS